MSDWKRNGNGVTSLGMERNANGENGNLCHGNGHGGQAQGLHETLNGSSNGSVTAATTGTGIGAGWEGGVWSVGLLNSSSKYLTAETFGFKTNANGQCLRKKQIWLLEPSPSLEQPDAVSLKSHLGRYLAVDTFGNVTCEAEEREVGSFFQIQQDFKSQTGGWALRNLSRGYFLGSAPDKLTCTAKVPARTELWSVHLCARPQVTLRNVGRKRFARLAEGGDEVVVDSNVPWGSDTLFTLQFRQGRYALQTPNNKFLSTNGKLLDSCEEGEKSSSLFWVEYHKGHLGLRDSSGLYVAPIGAKAVLRTRSTTVTKDELFVLQDSLPQAGFVSGLNSRFVSVKQGVDVTANQEDISDDEVFQLEYEAGLGRWYLRTMKDKYWTLETQGGIQAAHQSKNSNALFEFVWSGDGSLGFRANNGKFLGAKRSGHLYANCEAGEEHAKFFFYLVNRPRLVLRCEQGYVGFKSPSAPRLECNKASYETIQLERGEKGTVRFKMGGKYCVLSGEGDGEGLSAEALEPEMGLKFTIELREPTRIAIKTETGRYLNALKNGQVGLGERGQEPSKATQWEF